MRCDFILFLRSALEGFSVFLCLLRFGFLCMDEKECMPSACYVVASVIVVVTMYVCHQWLCFLEPLHEQALSSLQPPLAEEVNAMD